MISLYFFGTEALMVLGAQRFLSLYLGGGVVSALATLFGPTFIRRFVSYDVDNALDRFFNQQQNSSLTRSLGASGAVSAVVIWGIILNPWRAIFIFPIPLPIPSWLVGVGFISQDLYGAINRPNSTIGHSAHLGGAAFGAAYYIMWRRGR